MKKITHLLILYFFLSSTLAQAVTLYVAPNGNDANPGTIDRPLKSLKGARDKVRTQGSSDITVYFRGGVYPIKDTVNFDNRDSGSSAGNPIIYSSYPGEVAYFDGLKRVDSTKFTKVTGSLLNRLPKRAHGKVYSQVIKDQAVINLLNNDDAGISFNNRMMRLSRFPETGLAHAKNYVRGSEASSGEGTYDNPLGANFKMKESIEWDKYKAELNRRSKQGFIFGYVSADWLKEKLRIHSIGNNKNFKLVQRSRYGFGGPSHIERFSIKNMLYALSHPGEWFFDELDKRLYIYPYSDNPKSAEIGIWAGPMVANINDTNHIAFRRFIFQNIGKGVNSHGVINVRKGNNINIEGCTFRFISAPITAVNFWHDVKNSSVVSSDFYDIPNATRLYGGSVSVNNITHGRNKIINSHFTQVDSQDFYGKATGITGAGNTFKNNLVHNMNGQPITYAGFDHILERNEVFNVGIEEGDGGAFYTGGSVWSYGNKIRQNFVHHIMSIPDLLPRAAFFSDDYDGGDTYEENITYKGGGETIKMNAGSGHTVARNIMIKGGDAVKLLGRTSTYNRSLEEAKRYLREDPDSRNKENYLGRAEKVIGDFVNNNTGVYNESWNNSFHAKRYPGLKASLRFDNSLGMKAKEIRVYNNLFNGTRKNFTHPTGYGTEKGSRNISTDIFKDVETLNFAFKSPRPSYAPNIDFGNIGLYIDGYRKSIPDKNSYRKSARDRWRPYTSFDNSRYDSNTINSRLYYNTGALVSPSSQSGLGHNTISVNLTSTEYNYDFGTPTSPVQNGWTRVSPLTQGDIHWNGKVRAVDRGTGNINDINRDLVYSTSNRVLRHKIANGTWTVTLNMGDKNSFHDFMNIKAEGQLKKSGARNNAGEFTYVVFDIQVMDGWLDIEFSDTGGSDPNWVLTRMSLKKKLVDPNTISVNLTSTEYNYDFGTPVSPVQNGWTRVSPLTQGDINWNGDVRAVDRGTGNVNDINRDLVYSTSNRVLRHKIANGTWTVTLNMGDKTNFHDFMNIKAEGQLKKSGARNNVGEFPYVLFDVRVTDGWLDIEFSDTGGSDPNWVLTRMSLKKK